MFAHVTSRDRSSYIIVQGELIEAEGWRVLVSFKTGDCDGVVRRTITDLHELDYILSQFRNRHGWFGARVTVETLLLVNEVVRRLILDGFAEAFDISDLFRHLLHADPVATKHSEDD